MKKTVLSFLLIGFVNLVNAQVPTYIPTNHLQLWMPFAGNANDQSGNGNNGIVVTSTLTTDRFNKVRNRFLGTGG